MTTKRKPQYKKRKPRYKWVRIHAETHRRLVRMQKQRRAADDSRISMDEMLREIVNDRHPTYLIEGQPDKCEIKLMVGNIDPAGNEMTYHAMTVGMGYDTKFFRCPHGVPKDVKQVNGKWYWVMKGATK